MWLPELEGVDVRWATKRLCEVQLDQPLTSDSLSGRMGGIQKGQQGLSENCQGFAQEGPSWAAGWAGQAGSSRRIVGLGSEGKRCFIKVHWGRRPAELQAWPG